MKVNDIEMDAVILGNGEYPTHSMPETMLIMAPYVRRVRRRTHPKGIYTRCHHRRRRLALTGEQGTVQDHLPPDRRPGDERSDQSGTLPARPRQKNNHPRGCNRQTGRPYPGKHQSADRLYESRSAGNDADGPRNVYSGIGEELFQLQRHRTEGRWAGISAQ